MVGATQARRELGTIVDRVQHQGDAYIVSRRGEPAAVVVPLKVYESWKRQREEFFELIRKAQQKADLEPQEAERLVADAVATIRAVTPKARPDHT
jgi:prevent-host-death family protein